MPILTVSANSFRTAYHSESGWHSTQTRAFQGCWDNGSSRVGVMVFDELGETLKGTRINSINMQVMIDSGTNKPNRTITFYSSNYQYVDTSILGTAYPKSQLGTLVGNGISGTGTASTYPGTQIFVLDASSNAGLFNAMAAYLVAGNKCLLLFNGETSNMAGYSFSQNYLAFGACELTIDYDIVHTVRFDANGVGAAPNTQTVVDGDSLDLPMISASGYAFQGWSTDPMATSGMGGTYTPEASVTLYAVWKKIHTVTFNANGVGVAPIAVSVVDGNTIDLPELAAGGYEFLGWVEDSEAIEGMTGAFKPTDSVTLFAIWKQLGTILTRCIDGKPVKRRMFRKINGKAVRVEMFRKIDGVPVKL